MLDRTVLVRQTECSRPTSRVTKNVDPDGSAGLRSGCPRNRDAAARVGFGYSIDGETPARKPRAGGSRGCGVTEIKRASKGPVESGHGALLRCWEAGGDRPAGPNTSSVEERRDRVGHTAIEAPQNQTGRQAATRESFGSNPSSPENRHPQQGLLDPVLAVFSRNHSCGAGPQPADRRAGLRPAPRDYTSESRVCSSLPGTPGYLAAEVSVSAFSRPLSIDRSSRASTDGLGVATRKIW